MRSISYIVTSVLLIPINNNTLVRTWHVHVWWLYYSWKSGFLRADKGRLPVRVGRKAMGRWEAIARPPKLFDMRKLILGKEWAFLCIPDFFSPPLIPSVQPKFSSFVTLHSLYLPPGTLPSRFRRPRERRYIDVAHNNIVPWQARLAPLSPRSYLGLESILRRCFDKLGIEGGVPAEKKRLDRDPVNLEGVWDHGSNLVKGS